MIAGTVGSGAAQAIGRLVCYAWQGKAAVLPLNSLNFSFH